LGTISSIEHALSSLDDRLSEREADVKQYQRQSEDLGKQLNQPFEHEEKLSTATKRQQEIISALDLTKNQATASVDEGAPEKNETVQEKPEQAVRMHSNGVSALHV